MRLKDTINAMCSDDYKERLKAEYNQTNIRYNRLNHIISDYETGQLGFTLTCPVSLLKLQLAYMGNYLHILKVRLKMEDIDV